MVSPVRHGGFIVLVLVLVIVIGCVPFAVNEIVALQGFHPVRLDADAATPRPQAFNLKSEIPNLKSEI